VIVFYAKQSKYILLQVYLPTVSRVIMFSQGFTHGKEKKNNGFLMPKASPPITLLTSRNQTALTTIIK
jgi:hypothetical protein